jgi:hypothetical protein
LQHPLLPCVVALVGDLVVGVIASAEVMASFLVVVPAVFVAVVVIAVFVVSVPAVVVVVDVLYYIWQLGSN